MKNVQSSNLFYKMLEYILKLFMGQIQAEIPEKQNFLNTSESMFVYQNRITKTHPNPPKIPNSKSTNFVWPNTIDVPTWYYIVLSTSVLDMEDKPVNLSFLIVPQNKYKKYSKKQQICLSIYLKKKSFFSLFNGK